MGPGSFAKRRPWTEPAHPQRGPNWAAGTTSPLVVRMMAARRLSDWMGRAAGASFGRGQAERQSPRRPTGPAPRPNQPSRRRSPPDGSLGDSLKSQNRSAPRFLPPTPGHAEP